MVTSARPNRRFSIVVEPFDLSAPILQGKIPADGIAAYEAPGGEWQVVSFLNGTFDIGEIPFSRYVFCRDQGDPITAIPVFTDRRFVHQYAFTRTDTGINGPEDIRGRRVVVAGAYYTTSPIWLRGILADDYGIQPQEMTWYSIHSELDERMRTPSDVEVVVGQGVFPGAERLLDGSGDVLLTGATPVLSAADRSRVKRIFPDAVRVQREWHSRTGFHPLIHVIVVRNEALAAWPELGRYLCNLFDASKAYVYEKRRLERHTSLPFQREYLDETVELFGNDPWPYGIETNRPVLEKSLDYFHQQGLTHRRWKIEELFDQAAAGHEFTARLVQ